MQLNHNKNQKKRVKISIYVHLSIVAITNQSTALNKQLLGASINMMDSVQHQVKIKKISEICLQFYGTKKL